MLQTLYNAQPRQATWLELFFDLVFVAVIGVVTHELAYTQIKI
jgi:low temperature requirement protein LtrA